MVNSGTVVTSYRLLSHRQKAIPRNSVYIRQNPRAMGKANTCILTP